MSVSVTPVDFAMVHNSGVTKELEVGVPASHSVDIDMYWRTSGACTPNLAPAS